MPIELIARFDAKRAILGLTSRTKTILIAMDRWATSEVPIIDEPSICVGCKYAGTTSNGQTATHCGEPGRVIREEPDRDWNERCAPGEERRVRRVCACEVCRG